MSHSYRLIAALARLAFGSGGSKELELARGFAEGQGCRIQFVRGVGGDDPTAEWLLRLCHFGVRVNHLVGPGPLGSGAWRLLRPGGALSVLGNHPFLMTCVNYTEHEPAGRHLKIPYFGLHRLQWVDGDNTAVNFNLTVSGWMDLFRRTGFEIVAYHELQAPRTSRRVHFNVSDRWARSWPAEQVWKLQKPGPP